MKKIAYILSYMGRAVAVIMAADENELKEKLKPAIQEEVGAETDTQFTLGLEEVGDYGETSTIFTQYVQDGALIDDNEFTVMKTVDY